MRRLFVFAIAINVVMMSASREARALDSGVIDAGSPPDASVPDASVPDASVTDASTTDASSIDASSDDASSDDDSGVSTGRPEDQGDNELPGDTEEAMTSSGGCSCSASGLDGGSLSAWLLVALSLATKRRHRKQS